MMIQRDLIVDVDRLDDAEAIVNCGCRRLCFCGGARSTRSRCAAHTTARPRPCSLARAPAVQSRK